MQRPEYRSGRIDRAVKTYTVCDESRYLIIRNVPALGCSDELVKLFGLYGDVEEYRMLDEEDCEPFTDVYWIKYAKYNNSRFAKRKLDNYKFLGSLLDVSYAPNEETLTDTKNKLEERRRAVLNKIRANHGVGFQHPTGELSQLKDPLLELPSEAHQYPTFPLQLLPRDSRPQPSALASAPPETQGSIRGAPANTKHFPSASMNATVQSIREKLRKISEVSPVATSAGQEIHGATAGESLASDGPGKRSILEDNLSLPTKKKQDTRRRI